MKKILTFCVIFLLAFNAVVLDSCSRDIEPNSSTSASINPTTDSTIVIDSTVNQAGNTVIYQTNTAQIKEYNHTYLWISVVVLLVSNIICLFLLSLLFISFDRKSCDSVNRKYNIGKLKEDVAFLMSLSNKKVEKQIVNVVNNSLSDADFDIIVDRVRECLRLDELEKTNTASSQINTPVSQTRTMYASRVGEDMLLKVYEHPTDTTVYSLKITDDNEASFSVYEGAKDRVLNCEDFLNYACNVASDGNSSTGIECEAGTAEKTNENMWIVVKKANVKFV